MVVQRVHCCLFSSGIPVVLCFSVQFSLGSGRLGLFVLGLWVSLAMSPSLSKHAVTLLRGPQAWCGGSWFGFQDLSAMGAVSIWELAADSGSSWMSQAPNLHLVIQLLIRLNGLCFVADITCALIG